MTSFDLFRNPFVLLGADLSASPKEIVEAFEEALSQGRYSESDLTAARQELLRPLLRLQAEISSLFDTPRREWRAILTALRLSQNKPKFREVLVKVPALSRSNVLAQLLSRTSSDASLLTAWVNAQSEIKLDIVHSEVQRFHKIAGIAPPERAALAAALNELRDQQAGVLFAGSPASSSDTIEAVITCTKKVISNGKDDNIATLSSLLNAYRHHIDQELLIRHQRVTATIADLRANPDGPGNLAIVIDALKFWNVAAKPLQLLEAHKSRSEPHSQEVFQEIRSAAVDLANQSSRFDIALSLTKACQLEFANLPRAHEQLIEDENTLKDRIVAKKIEPLATLITKLDDELDTLATDLKYGFGESAVGLAKSLRNTFIAAVKDSEATATEDTPWFLLRSLGLKLNNDREDPKSALALTEGMLVLSRQLSTSDTLVTRLVEDKRAIQRNLLDKELIGHLKANRYRDALSAIGTLLQNYKSPQERDTLLKLKSEVTQKRIGKYLGWGFVAVLVVGGTFATYTDHSGSPTTRAPSNYGQTVPSWARDYGEEMPPVGTGRTFSEANIRYCEFQKIRLNFIKPRVFTNFEVDAFNQLVEDYNSRCSSYRYRQDDWSNVQAELAEKQADLEAQAERILNGWGSQQ